MKLPIDNAADIGKVVRASRKAQRIRQDDAAGSIGVSKNFLGKVERGGESVQSGKLFQVLHGLGIRVVLDLPESVADYSWLRSMTCSVLRRMTRVPLVKMDGRHKLNWHGRFWVFDIFRISSVVCCWMRQHR